VKAELLKNIARLEDQLAQKDTKERAGTQERPRPQPRRAAASAGVSKGGKEDVAGRDKTSVAQESKFQNYTY
jgi:hypothetical protein